VACTDNEPDWEAGPGKPGVFHIEADLDDERAVALLDITRNTRALVDLLVVSLHWGPNWGYEPLPGHRPLAQALIDTGTDIVFGHSCHVFRGIEIYRQRPIIYCAGDFIDDYAVDHVHPNDQSLMFIVDVEGGEPRRLLLQPTMIEDFHTRLAHPHEADEILHKMSYLCARLSTPMRHEGRIGDVEIADSPEGVGSRAGRGHAPSRWSAPDTAQPGS
jgi:poly-gamma-glutamate synthesis protein (capsule biosynthesis protein)